MIRLSAALSPFAPHGMSGQAFQPNALVPSGNHPPFAGPARRFQLHIRPANPHTVIWDAQDHEVWAWPCTFNILDAKPRTDLPSRSPISTIYLEFRSVDPGSASYSVTWVGQTASKEEVIQRMNPGGGICVSPQRTYLEPAEAMAAGVQAPGGLWGVEFWVPVPMSLFARLESRRFRMRARIEVRVSDDRTRRDEFAVCENEVEVSIEHLHRRRFMQ